MASALGSIVMTSRSICAKILPHLLCFHHLPSPPDCAKIFKLEPGPHTWNLLSVYPNLFQGALPSQQICVSGRDGSGQALFWGPWEISTHILLGTNQ